jgi:lantibiotic biosynthesis protein
VLGGDQRGVGVTPLHAQVVVARRIGWRPLLDGALADSAIALARDIARAIAESRGASGDRTLFWAYASAALDDEPSRSAYDAALDELVATVLAGAAHPALFNDGLAGMGWVLAHVVDDGGGELLPSIDAALVRAVSTTPWPGDFDLTQGLVGIGMYFLERLRGGRSDAARDGLALVVAHLAAAAERTGDGRACWFTAPERLPAHIRQVCPDGRHDCGVAHGIGGVIALLGRAAALDDPPVGARELGEAAVRWLIAQRMPLGELGGRFPAAILPGRPVEPARSAWCYGDLGLACVLWGADRLGAPAGLAREIALEGATRATTHYSIEDVALCHGSAGIAHLYNRLAQASGEDAFRDAARRWFEATIVSERMVELPGFALWGNHWPRLIDGAMGVALALLAAATPIAPNWDRMLLCDLAPA